MIAGIAAAVTGHFGDLVSTPIQFRPVQTLHACQCIWRCEHASCVAVVKASCIKFHAFIHASYTI